MNRIIIYAREPKHALPNLKAEIGPEKAQEVYERNLYQLVAQCSIYSLVIITPDSKEYFLGHFPKTEVYQLEKGNLGDQLREAISLEIQSNPKVMLIADNCPLVDAPTMEHAFFLLDEFDIVLGPSNNGPYYLVGLNNHVNLNKLFNSKDDILGIYAGFNDNLKEYTVEQLEPKQSLVNAEDYQFFVDGDLL